MTTGRINQVCIVPHLTVTLRQAASAELRATTTATSGSLKKAQKLGAMATNPFQRLEPLHLGLSLLCDAETRRAQRKAECV